MVEGKENRSLGKEFKNKTLARPGEKETRENKGEPQALPWAHGTRRTTGASSPQSGPRGQSPCPAHLASPLGSLCCSCMSGLWRLPVLLPGIIFRGVKASPSPISALSSYHGLSGEASPRSLSHRDWDHSLCYYCHCWCHLLRKLGPVALNQT